MLLLDTHALIWWVREPKRIPRDATRAIEKALRNDHALGVSSISIREIGMLAAARRIRLGADFDTWMQKVEALPVLAFYPVDNRVAQRSVALSLATNDPIDRIIVSTALVHGATLITGDEQIRAYESIRTIWD